MKDPTTLYCQTGETLVTFEANSKIAPLLYDTEIFNEFSGLLNQTRRRLLEKLWSEIDKLIKFEGLDMSDYEAGTNKGVGEALNIINKYKEELDSK